MADINQTITLGIGNPSGIAPFILVGLVTGLTLPSTVEFMKVRLFARAATVLFASKDPH